MVRGHRGTTQHGNARAGWVKGLLIIALWLLGPAFNTRSLAQAPEGGVKVAGPVILGNTETSEPQAGDLVRNGIGLVILAMSFYMVALVVWMAFEYRRAVAMPETLVHDLEIRLQQKRPADAYEKLLPDRSFLSRVLSPGVRRLKHGTPAAIRAMELANEQVTLEMEARAGYLATVAALGPMIGLLGTVYGMIISFGVISRSSDTPQPGALAAGISTSLLSTLEGIAIAVPAIAFASLFRSRIARLSAEVQTQAESLLDLFLTATEPVNTTTSSSATTSAAPHPLATAAWAAAARSRGTPPETAPPRS